MEKKILGGGGVEFFFLETVFFLINIEKCPFKFPGGGGGVVEFFFLENGRWFLQIVDRDSGNLYIQYNPLFPCSDF